MKSIKTVDQFGTERWITPNGKCHRIDGPAILWSDGEQHWFLNDKCHRTDGPAIILASGEQQWRVNGKRHRTDGPAVIYADGTQEWFLNNIRYTKQQFNDKIKRIKELEEILKGITT